MPINSASIFKTSGHVRVYHAPQDELVITTKSKHTERPPFQMIGMLNTERRPVTMLGKDLIEIMDDLPKGARNLFRNLKYRINRDTNFLVYPTSHLTASEYSVFMRNLKVLKNANVIKKVVPYDKRVIVKKSQYIINPELIIPFDFEEAKSVWEVLK